MGAIDKGVFSMDDEKINNKKNRFFSKIFVTAEKHKEIFITLCTLLAAMTCINRIKSEFY